jgi:16S rRNA (guanine966-N2)-methyltransferase
LRIIGGSRRGKKLYRPKGLSIRPTADRVRESIFNIIHRQITGASVLDLFAGTGAMGLEALSRGATCAAFIDNHPAALALIEKNIEICRWRQQTKTIRWDIRQNLNCIKSPPVLYDLVFIDPPYRLKIATTTLAHLNRAQVLTGSAIIIVEHARTDPINDDIDAFLLEDQRPYGKTLVSFLRYMV